MIEIVCHHEVAQLPLGRSGKIPVLMYGASPPRQGTGSIGRPVVAAVRRLGVPAHAVAFDFLTIAMAVTAADTFVNRAKASDGWAREFRVSVSLDNPAPWVSIKHLLEKALNFLSGDTWNFQFSGGGPTIPEPQIRGRLTSLDGHDCASLFSGGLDSSIGALDLLSKGRRPVLISHAYRGDSDKQAVIRSYLPSDISQFSAIANPVSKLDESNDVQMRTRSFNFIAYGALVAATMAKREAAMRPVDLFVPENGLIALNPPLTFRRIGSLSTRTTHPYFLALIEEIFAAVKIPVRIMNPYSLKTKGEMILGCSDRDNLLRFAARTVSCGKWKRTNIQCGKCVPCLIRRASFHAAGVKDETKYSPLGTDLTALLDSNALKDDLMAMILASNRLSTTQVRRWIPNSGPLPSTRIERDKLLQVATRGMNEVKSYLHSQRLLG